jgi:hypothetical protein
MKINRNTAIWGICAALQLFSTYSTALTLGRVRGGTVLGKELDVSVLVQYAADEDVTATCFDADLFFGDTLVERSRYSVSARTGQQPNTQLVRIQSIARVDDALVKLNLKTTCGPKASRSYALLPDVASEILGSGALFPGAALVTKDESLASTAAKPVVSPEGGAPIGANVQTIPVTNASKVPSAPRAAKSSVPSPVKADFGARSRVQVSAAALEDLHKRVDDIAKWQADNSGSDVRLRNDERAKALQAGIRDLQAVTAKNQQSIQLVATAVEGTVSRNNGNTLLYLMAALLALSMAALVYVIRRTRSDDPDAAPWWSAQDERAHASVHADKAVKIHTAVRPAPSVPSAPAGVPKANPSDAAASGNATTLPQRVQAENSDFGLFDTSGTQNRSGQPVTLAQSKPKGERNDFTPSGHGTLRAVNTREMLDVRQQADFFMALGQHDEAVRMLESNIKGSSDANPLVYLDLLKILHTLSRRTDFERYREEFNAQFTGRVPGYAEFLVEGNGIEAYEDICRQIMVLWPTEYTIDFIEQCLVRTPEDDPEQGMDLEAFKDLLLLYGVLKRLDQFFDSSLAPFSASRPAVEIGRSAHAELETVVATPLPTISAAFARAPDAAVGTDIDLDIDLNIGGDTAQKPASGNLIDFDVSDYSGLGKKPAADKP